MHYWALIALILALVAAVLGISGIAGAAVKLIWICVLACIVLAIVCVLKGGKPPV